MKVKIAIIICIVVAAVSFFITINSNTKVKNEEYEEEIVKGKILLYFAQNGSLELGKEYRFVPMESIKNDIAKTIVEELIKGPISENYVATIPKETKINKIEISDNRIILDLSKEFEEKHTGGAMTEALTIYSIVNSLTEITEINEVKFLIDGEEKEKFKDDFKFNDAFIRQ